jgi:hypothetical protein
MKGFEPILQVARLTHPSIALGNSWHISAFKMISVQLSLSAISNQD